MFETLAKFTTYLKSLVFRSETQNKPLESVEAIPVKKLQQFSQTSQLSPMDIQYTQQKCPENKIQIQVINQLELKEQNSPSCQVLQQCIQNQQKSQQKMEVISDESKKILINANNDNHQKPCQQNILIDILQMHKKASFEIIQEKKNARCITENEIFKHEQFEKALLDLSRKQQNKQERNEEKDEAISKLINKPRKWYLFLMTQYKNRNGSYTFPKRLCQKLYKDGLEQAKTTAKPYLIGEKQFNERYPRILQKIIQKYKKHGDKIFQVEKCIKDQIIQLKKVFRYRGIPVLEFQNQQNQNLFKNSTTAKKNRQQKQYISQQDERVIERIKEIKQRLSKIKQRLRQLKKTKKIVKQQKNQTKQ